MKITKRQLKRMIREEVASTKKYDDDSALKGDQDELPDDLQKGIIDKVVEDREEHEEEKNESVRITKRQLRRIIKEGRRKLVREGFKETDPGKGIALELRKTQYGYEGADQDTYDNAYTQIMDLVAEMGHIGGGLPPDPAVQAALWNALTEVAKELELEMELT
mgnify:FL=1